MAEKKKETALFYKVRAIRYYLCCSRQLRRCLILFVEYDNNITTKTKQKWRGTIGSVRCCE